MPQAALGNPQGRMSTALEIQPTAARPRARRSPSQRPSAADALQACARDLGLSRVTKLDYELWKVGQPEAPDVREIFRGFDDWRGACRAAGLDTPRGRPGQESMAEVEASLRKARESVGTRICPRAYERLRREDPSLVPQHALLRFYGSFELAVESAGMRSVPYHAMSELSDDEIVGFIRHNCTRAGRPLTVRGYDAARDKASIPPEPAARNLILEWRARHGGGWPELLAAAGFPKASG